MDKSRDLEGELQAQKVFARREQERALKLAEESQRLHRELAVAQTQAAALQAQAAALQAQAAATRARLETIERACPVRELVRQKQEEIRRLRRVLDELGERDPVRTGILQALSVLQDQHESLVRLETP